MSINDDDDDEHDDYKYIDYSAMPLLVSKYLRLARAHSSQDIFKCSHLQTLSRGAPFASFLSFTRITTTRAKR